MKWTKYFALISLSALFACTGESITLPDSNRYSLSPTQTSTTIDWSDQVTVDLAQYVGLGDQRVYPFDVSADAKTISFIGFRDVDLYDFYVWTGEKLYQLHKGEEGLEHIEGVNSRGQAVSLRTGRVWTNGVWTQLRGPCGPALGTRYISESGMVAGQATVKIDGKCTDVRGPALWRPDGTYVNGWPSNLDFSAIVQSYDICDGVFEAINDFDIASGSIYCSGMDGDIYTLTQFPIRYMQNETRVVAKDPPADAIGDWCAADKDGTMLESKYTWNDGGYKRISDFVGIPADFRVICGQGFGSDGSITGILDSKGIGAIWKNGILKEFPSLSYVAAVSASGEIVIGGKVQDTQSSSAAERSLIEPAVGSSSPKSQFGMVRPISTPERLDRLCLYATELKESSLITAGQQTSLCTQLRRASELSKAKNQILYSKALDAIENEIQGIATSRRLSAEILNRFKIEIQKAR